MRRPDVERIALGLLAVAALPIGIQAALAPRSFFDDFPLPGRDWVSLAGAYDEHLVRDVGGLYLALGVVTAWAVLRPQVDLFRVVGIAWEVFSVPHLLFHLGHLDGLDTFDKVAESTSLAVTVVLAALLLFPVSGGRARPGSG